MIRQQRADGAIILMAENEQERTLLSKISVPVSKYKHLMNPQSTYKKNKSYSRNRKCTKGRKYKFIPNYRVIGSPLQAITLHKEFTSTYRKVAI